MTLRTCYCNQGSNEARAIHCFVNGVCHLCNLSCSHVPSDLDQHYLHYLPSGHELREFSDYTDSYHYYLFSMGTFVENGECKLCLMPVDE